MVTVLLIAHVFGLFSSFHALMSTRTAQGSIAWIVSLNTFPLITVPAYWVFGRNKFQGYVSLRRQVESGFDDEVETIGQNLKPYVQEFDTRQGGAQVALRLAELPYLNRNGVELLINGEATFNSILAGIDKAEKYILVQFYIVRDDGLGRRLKDRLIAKSREGVKVWFLYDEIGSRNIDRYLQDLKGAGVAVSSFHSTRGGGNRFQLNFRNHRKIVVVDGKAGWVGGLNVGDEYLRGVFKPPDWRANWRDTHMKIVGPSVLQLQLSFVEDWRWAKNEDQLSLSWEPVAAEKGNAAILVLPTGPADRLESCSLMFQQAIHSARERIWIASPYFIPDEGVMAALHLAGLRGVDIRVIIPDVSDSWLVYYSAYAFISDLLESGIGIYRYQPGFLHEKVFLVDDRVAAVGTANFDNRSFRLNFEITALVIDKTFITEVEQMFKDDFRKSQPMTMQQVNDKPLWFKVLSRAAYLTAPIQ
ncbi:MAG: cardiolipin synthase [Thermodesulfobacteriota bacterium]